MACLLKCYYDFKMKHTEDKSGKEDIKNIMNIELERMSKKDFKLDTQSELKPYL